MDPSSTTNTDPTAPAATPVTTAPPATAPAEGKSFNQEQVNAIVKQRLEEDRARRTPQQPPAQATQPAPASQPVQVAPTDGEQHMTPKQMRDELNELKLRSRFDKHALKRGIDGDAAEDMFELFKVQKPADDAKWFDDKSSRFGFQGSQAAPTAATTTQPQAPTEAPKPAAPAAPKAPTTPVSPTTHQGLVDLFGLTHEAIDQLGPTGMRQHFEAALAVGRQQAGVPQRPKVPARK